jgi:hypothetical protein
VNGLGHTTAPLRETPEIPLAVVTAPVPVRIFEEVVTNWDHCKTDTRCIAWVLHSSTDIDVIYSTVRFAVDTIWYPEIAGALSPHILADLFLECFMDGRVVSDKLEHARMIGMALASVLSIQLSLEPKDEDLKVPCTRIRHNVDWAPLSEPTFLLTAEVLNFVAQTPSHISIEEFPSSWIFDRIPKRLSTMCKLWLSRVILQTLWRWRRVQDPTTVLHFYRMGSVCERLMADGGQTLITLKANCVLIMAISLGLSVDMRDLYAPSTKYVLYTVFHGIH